MRLYKIAKSALVYAAAFAIAAAPGMVAAQTNDTSVINTGDDTSVVSNNSQSSSTNVSNSNTATVSQSVNASADTGNNTASGNIGGGSVTTGPATVTSSMGVNANHNATLLSGNINPLTVNATDVLNTGDDASVFTNSSSNNSLNVSNSNSANVNQSVYAAANSGYNSADENIGGGTVHTNAATIGTNMGVALNHNTTGIGGGAGQAGLLNDTSVTNTGDGASVYSNVNNTSSVNVANSNSAYVTQALFGNANSGYNSASENIGGGYVTSGPAIIGAMMGVDANHNATGIGSGMGASALSFNINDFVNTGDDASANAQVTDTSNTSVVNVNSLYSTQSSWQHTSSGWNATDDNIGGGIANTSGAGIGSAYGVAGNHNVTSFGNMMGSLAALMSMM